MVVCQLAQSPGCEALMSAWSRAGVAAESPLPVPLLAFLQTRKRRRARGSPRRAQVGSLCCCCAILTASRLVGLRRERLALITAGQQSRVLQPLPARMPAARSVQPSASPHISLQALPSLPRQARSPPLPHHS